MRYWKKQPTAMRPWAVSPLDFSQEADRINTSTDQHGKSFGCFRSVLELQQAAWNPQMSFKVTDYKTEHIII